MAEFEYADLIYQLPDYPQPGILFEDVTPLFDDAAAMKEAVDMIAEHYKDAGVTKVVGPEARGFLIGAPVAYALQAGFVPARKPGKLPRETVSTSYALEYGTDTLEIHKDAISSDDVVLIVDDLVATGGTIGAVCDMVKGLGAKVAGYAFIDELEYLNPREAIAKHGDEEVYSLVVRTEGC